MAVAISLVVIIDPRLVLQDAFQGDASWAATRDYPWRGIERTLSKASWSAIETRSSSSSCSAGAM